MKSSIWGVKFKMPIESSKRDIKEVVGHRHEMKRRMLLGTKTMTNLNSILKSTDIILLTKFCLVKAMVFPVVMYGSKSWTIKS